MHGARLTLVEGRLVEIEDNLIIVRELILGKGILNITAVANARVVS